MKIGIDGLLLTIPFPCGTKNYAYELINQLAKIDKKNEYFIFATKNVKIPKQKNFNFIKVPNISPVLKRQIIQPLLVKSQKVDIFHYLEPYGSIIHKHPKIVTTVHDVDLSNTYPLKRDPLKRINGEILKYFTFKNSKVFITPSKTVKKEFRNVYKNSSVYTIKEGVGSNFKVIKNIRKKGDNFFLAMGDFAPRKNITKTLEAYLLLPASFKKKYKLVIIASTSHAKEKFEEDSQKLGISHYVKVLKNVPRKRLIELYNKAVCFLYPSLYEGFGLPILEAMACGCPVITSNYGAMKELAGNCAYLINPKSATQIADAMKKVANSKRAYDGLRKRGLQRAKLFSWKETARQTLNVYSKLYRI